MTSSKENPLSFVQTEQYISQRLEEEKAIDVRLPEEGFLYMERPLPFIMIYRFNHNKDPFIEGLIKNEASGLSVKDTYYLETRHLLNRLAKTLSTKFGAFLIIEIWSSQDLNDIPTFKILASDKKLPSTFHHLLEQLSNVTDFQYPFQSEIKISQKRCSEHLESLFQTDELKKMESLLIGLEIPAFYRNLGNGQIYPLVSRDLKRILSQIFQKTFFEFIKVQTDHNLKNFQILGKRNLDKIVWEVDEQLAAINNVYDFLLLVSPINSSEAWTEFQENNFRKAPVFHYRMIPMDPEKLKRKLFNIPIEHVDDPTLGYLFRDKRGEIDKMLTMLNSRNTEEFMYGSLQVYGGVKNNLLNIAKGLLTAYPFEEGQDDDSDDDEGLISVAEFIDMVKKEFEFLKEQYPAVETKVKLKSDITGLMVSKGALLIGTDIKSFSPKRARALIQHEIGTHSLTYYNGKAQPLKLLYSGVPGYEELQEGLAVFAEYLSGGLTKYRMQILAARVIAADSLIKGNDFINTFFMLKDEFNIDNYTAYIISMRVYRGGGLTKDIVYLRGIVHLLEYLKEGNDLAPLLIGKIRQDNLPVINELISRRILKPAPLKPRYLVETASLERLRAVDKNKTLFNLI